MKIINGGVTTPAGFTASGIYCGIKKGKTTGKPDLAMIYSPVRCVAAAVYTANLVKAAPITLTMEHLFDGYAQTVICNSGNANACNTDGEVKARAMTACAAEALGIAECDVIVASTGVIGQPLNIDAIKRGMPELAASLSPSGGDIAAEAIMTTDLVKKQMAVDFEIGGKTCRIGGMAKGSGMIEPNMATMLCFLTTDVAIEPDALAAALKTAANVSLNRLSVDGDTSTNDMCSIMASGLAGNTPIHENSDDYEMFKSALSILLVEFAKMIARDGEGATKLIECEVSGAANEADAVKLGKSVINSSLVKCAMFGADANCGRVLCALGYAGVAFDPGRITVDFVSAAGRVRVIESGAGLEFAEDLAKEILSQDTVRIEIDIGAGSARATVWGCDLTYDYVKINGDYRS